MQEVAGVRYQKDDVNEADICISETSGAARSLSIYRCWTSRTAPTAETAAAASSNGVLADVTTDAERSVTYDAVVAAAVIA